MFLSRLEAATGAAECDGVGDLKYAAANASTVLRPVRRGV